MALFLSDFDEILFLDNDNIVITDPTYLFDKLSEEPEATAIFWPDLWPLYVDNPAWK